MGYKGIGRVDLLRRSPSQVQLYRQYRARIREEYGDLNAFILRVKLGWGTDGQRGGGGGGGDDDDDVDDECPATGLRRLPFTVASMFR